MKRFLKKNMFNIPFALLLVLTMGFAGTWELPQENTPEPDSQKKAQIESVFAAEAEPAPEKPTVQEMIIQTSREYGIDPTLALAISKLETSHFTSKPYMYGNNVGGMKHKVGGVYVTMEFDTIEEGVERYVQMLSKYYVGIGLDTPDKMASKYCPDSPTDWAELVNKLM